MSHGEVRTEEANILTQDALRRLRGYPSWDTRSCPAAVPNSTAESKAKHPSEVDLGLFHPSRATPESQGLAS